MKEYVWDLEPKETLPVFTAKDLEEDNVDEKIEEFVKAKIKYFKPEPYVQFKVDHGVVKKNKKFRGALGLVIEHSSYFTVALKKRKIKPTMDELGKVHREFKDNNFRRLSMGIPWDFNGSLYDLPRIANKAQLLGPKPFIFNIPFNDVCENEEQLHEILKYKSVWDLLKGRHDDVQVLIDFMEFCRLFLNIAWMDEVKLTELLDYIVIMFYRKV